MEPAGLPIDPTALIGPLIILVGLLILYYFFMIRALLEMLRLKAHDVVIVFTYLSLIPFPLVLVLGIINLIVWRFYKKDLLAAQTG